MQQFTSLRFWTLRTLTRWVCHERDTCAKGRDVRSRAVSTIGIVDEQGAFERLIGGRSVLLVGGAGVGKTHRAASIATRLGTQDWAIERVVGSASLRTVPFGALHHLVGDASAQQPDELFFAAMGHLQRMAKERPILVVVDDIDGLDDGSVGLIHQLALGGIATIATVRTQSAGEPHVLPLWKDGALERVDVKTDERDTADLAAAFLDAVCQPELVAALQQLSGGNPLFVRELIADGRSSKAIEVVDGEARLTSPLPVAKRVSDLLSDRFAGLPAETSSALEVIAQVSPIDATLLASAVPLSALEDLETRGLIRVEVSAGIEGAGIEGAGSERVDVDHPLIGEIVRSRTSSLRSRRIRSDVGSGALQRGVELPDLVRALQWVLDAGGQPPSDDLVRGARACLGRFDPQGALRFAQSANPSFETLLTAAEAKARLGDLAGSESAFDAAAEYATDEPQIAAHARARASALWWNHGDMAAARALLNAALDQVHDARNRGPLVADLLLADAIGGNLGSALALGLPMLNEAELDEPTELSVLVCTTIAQTLTAQVDRLEPWIQRGFELAGRHRITHPAAFAQLTVTQASFEVINGRLDQARDAITERFEPPIPPVLDLFVGQAIVQIDLLAGNGAAACARIEQLGTIDDDAVGMTALRDALGSLVFASCGDIATSERLHNQATDNPLLSPRETTVLARAGAHRLAFEGNVDAAIDLLIEADTDHDDNWMWKTSLLYDAVRFDRAERVVDRLEQAQFSRPLLFLDAMIEHARAMVDADVKRLTLVSEAMADMGAMLFAAEAAAQAALYAAEDGDHTASARLTTRAHALFDRTDSMWSPAMQTCTPALSERETEVAELAAKQLSTKEIAEQLFVSTRTVDNHLRQVYRKLGLDGRQALAPLFASPN